MGESMEGMDCRTASSPHFFRLWYVIAQQLWGLSTELTAGRCELSLPVFQDNQQLSCSYMAINNNLEPGDYEYKESLRDIRAGIKKALYLSDADSCNAFYLVVISGDRHSIYHYLCVLCCQTW